jgi:gliding motility-associated-like protein
MRQHIFFTLALVFFFPLSFFAQQGRDCNYKRPHQADNWVFGNNTLIDFSGDDPVVSATSSFPLINGVAGISDEDGNLLMFTNGVQIWNGNFSLIEYGNGLKGNKFATQSSLIVPDPGNQYQYYVFTLDAYIVPVFTNGINYTLVSFKNKPGGTVLSKNNLLATKNDQKITSVRHANGKDYWVITHGFGAEEGDKFTVWLVTGNGVEEYKQFTIGFKHEGDDNNGAGYMKLSPNGKKLALVVPFDGVIELYDFDTETGELSHPEQVQDLIKYKYVFGVEFSPDNSKLYVTTSPLDDWTNFLYQFDLNMASPLDNPVVIDQFTVSQLGNDDSLMAALQLAVDGKIYMAKFKRGLLGKNFLGVINNPDRPGPECNYNRLDNVLNNGLYLSGSESLLGLPNFVTSFLDIPHFTFYNQCHHDTTEFKITNTANIEDTDWDFDDPGGHTVNNDLYYPAYVFSEPGDYTVELTETFNGIDYSYTYPVRIHPLPFVDIGEGSDTIYILPNSSITLDAGDYDFYEWQPDGSTGRYLDVTDEGLYSVIVTDSNCCRNYDEVYIKYSNLFFPNAFSPDSPVSLNREFKILGPVSALDEYHLLIYNRWGQKLFETNDPGEGWNGTYNGQEVPAGTYIWKAVYKSFESNIREPLQVENQGTVTVVK